MLRRFAPVMVVVLALLAACQSTPALTDPTDIITKGLDVTSKLNSLHASLALSGTFTVPGSGGSFKLDSTSLEADVDIKGEQVHLTFAVPALFGLSGEVVVIGKDVYIKTSMSGDKWMHQKNTVSSGGSAEPSASLDTAAMIKRVKDFLAKDGVVSKKLADVDCGDRKCYQVSLSIPPSLMASAGAAASMDPSSIFGDALVLNLLFDREKLWLAAVSTDITSTTAGTFSVTINLSKFDEAVTVSPPPEAQVTEGEFTLPGI